MITTGFGSGFGFNGGFGSGFGFADTPSLGFDGAASWWNQGMGYAGDVLDLGGGVLDLIGIGGSDSSSSSGNSSPPSGGGEGGGASGGIYIPGMGWMNFGPGTPGGGRGLPPRRAPAVGGGISTALLLGGGFLIYQMISD